MSDTFAPCAVIPVYNHEHALPAVVDALRAAGLPCVLVNDASSPECTVVIDSELRLECAALPSVDWLAALSAALSERGR